MHHASVPAPEWMREASTSRLHPVVRRLLVFAVVASAYTLGGELGLAYASIGRQVTLVWPPTGIALAALVLGGRRLWPAIAFGAAVTNLAQGAPLLFTVPVTIGNTLAMVIGASLLRGRGFDPSLERSRDVFDLLLRGALMPTLVSASIGTLAVCATHVAPWSAFFPVWSIWWVGDALGVVILAPLLLTLGRREGRKGLRASHVLSAIAAGSFAWLLCSVPYPLVWLLFPLVILIATRLGTRAAAMVVTAVCLASVAQTNAGHGIFGTLLPPLDLALLDLFLFVVAMTTLLAAAMVTEIQSAERARALLSAQVEQARERAELRELVLGAITHDLRNPLATISLSIDAVLKKEPSGEQRRLLDVAAAAALRMKGILGELFDYTEARLGAIRIEAAPTDLHAIVEEVCEEHRARRSDILIELDVRGRTTGFWDGPRLAQLIDNLLSNAIKHGTPGAPIDVSIESNESGATIAIHNSGSVIPPREQSDVFAAFHRGSGAHSRGLGLGLFICKAIATAHGGSIEVISDETSGTRMIVRLPWAAPAVTPSIT